jgi:hypothetical protein
MKINPPAVLLPLLLTAAAIPLSGLGLGKKTIEVKGVLTDEGVECQALRADDGTLYTLSGKLRGFKTGDRVRVTGTVAEVSICQQGITIEIRKIVADHPRDAPHPPPG